MLHFLRTNPARGCYNASQRGCGKTSMTIDVIKNLIPRLVIIVCPAIVKLNWRDELIYWGYASEEISLLDSLSDTKKVNGHKFIILSYGLTRNNKILNYLLKLNSDVLVLDEAHSSGLKNTRSVTKKAVLEKLWEKSHYKICLSGTPFTSSIEDCWTTFSRLAPEKFPSYYDFVNEYCYLDKTPWGDKYYGLKNHEKLKSIIRSNFFLRYTLEEMAPELPDVIWTKISLSHEEYAVVPTEKEKQDNEQYLIAMEAALGAGRAVPSPAKHLSTKRIEQGLKKLPAVLDLVKDLIESEESVLVFFCFLEPMKQFIELVKEHSPSIIHGGVSSEERYIEIKRFQDDETKLLVGQIHSMNTGVNLQQASSVVYAELDYSPAVIEQALGRASRIGQKRSINVYYPLVENTLEEGVARVVLSKSKIFNKILC